MVETSRRKLIEYLKKNISKGYTSESLKWALVSQGHSRVEVSEVINMANEELREKEEPIVKEKPKIKYKIYDKDNKLITMKKPFLKRFFG